MIYEGDYREKWLEGGKIMILLDILMWFGIMLAITSIVLALVWDSSWLAVFALGCVIVLLGCTLAFYDFGQLPPSFDWFRQLLI
jgi:hypothetical protein